MTRTVLLLACMLCLLPPLTGKELRGMWFMRFYKEKPVSEHLLYRTKHEGKVVHSTFPVDFSKHNEFYTKVTKGEFEGFQEVSCELEFPADFPSDAKVYFFAKDWDSQWYHSPVQLPKRCVGPLTFSIPLLGAEAAKRWEPGRHFRPWHQLTPLRLIEFGLKFSEPKGKKLDWRGEVLLRQITLKQRPLREIGSIRELRRTPAKVRRGDMVEIAFQLTHPLKDPFTRAKTDLRGEVLLPDGETQIIPCFYFEDFLQDKGDEFSKQVPHGHPEFRMRFTPVQGGEHVIRIGGKVEGSKISLPEFKFTVKGTRPGWRGFVRRMPKSKELLCYSEGNEEFWGQGLNVRSPYDTRYRDVFPATQWQPFNLNMYERLFKKYKMAGINVAEVWMSSWWLALEWIPDAPGNHGVGHMNQWRAWKLDRLLEWAEKYDVYIILAIHNHGKFSTWCDQEWARNPFNTANGGYLRQPDEYFSSSRAFNDYKRFADYMVARWGHSSRILAWKLFTEIDLTGSRGGTYKNPSVKIWHEKVGRYLKQIDPNRHLVTTHWSGNYQKAKESPALAGSSALDILTLDAYYNGTKGTHKLHRNLENTLIFQKQMQKPCIVTEFGGTPWADQLPHIHQQLRLALWNGFIGKFPATPCLWWFPLIEEENLYGEYKALCTFVKGETRKGMKASVEQTVGALRMKQLTSPNKAYIWLYDPVFFFQNDRLHWKGGFHKNIRVQLPNLKSGKYSVEFWNCGTGEVIDKRVLALSTDRELPVPAFRQDIAIKIRPINDSDKNK